MKNNEQHAIDIKVRQNLENLEVPYKADHWQSMAGKLDALDAEETGFDKHLATQLSHIEMPLNTSHWALMAGKLTALDAEETAFDNNLTAKLAGLEVPYQATSWADMSSRLDDLDKAEMNFDALLSQRLQNLDVKYQPKHWDMMADKIEQTFSWRAKIVRYKIVEVALVLLTFYTVGNMLDLPFDFTKESGIEKTIDVKDKGQKAKGNKQEARDNEQKAKETKSFYPSDWRNRPVVPNKNATGQPIVATNNVNNESTPNAAVAQFPAANSENKGLENGVLKNSGVIESKIAVSSPNGTAQTEVRSVFVEQTSTSTVPDAASLIVENTEGASAALQTREVFTVADISMKKVTILGKVINANPENDAPLLVGKDAIAAEFDPMGLLKPSLLNTDFYDANVVFPRQHDKKAKWRLNIFGSPSGDKVGANYLLYRDPDTLKQNVANLSAGFAVAYKKNKLEVEGGLTFLDKKYNLPNIEVVYGNFARSSSYDVEKSINVRLSIVSIPLSVNYTVKETPRWSFYARVGTAINTIFKSRVDIFKNSTNGSSGPPPPSITDYEPNVYPNGILEKDFFKNRKWLNGGLKENTYLTANAGLGVEYRLTRKTDIYLQPTFDYMFSKRGIGTLNDRYKSFSVQGGVKTKLK